jgi:hypothetical protein
MMDVRPLKANLDSPYPARQALTVTIAAVENDTIKLFKK